MRYFLLILTLVSLHSPFAVSDHHAVNCASKDVVAAYFTECSVGYTVQGVDWGYQVRQSLRILMCDGKIIEAPATENVAFFKVNADVTEAQAQHNAALACSGSRDEVRVSPRK